MLLRADQYDRCQCGGRKRVISASCRRCFLRSVRADAQKRCGGCDRVLPLSAFHTRPAANGARRPRARCSECEATAARNHAQKHPERRKATKRNWEKRNPEKLARMRLRRAARVLGLDEQEVLTAFELSDGRCRICREQCKTHERLTIDHDHVTGRFRGLLCMACNHGLGKFADDPNRLRKAAAYLEGTG